MSLELAASKYLTKWTQIHKKGKLLQTLTKFYQKTKLFELFVQT